MKLLNKLKQELQRLRNPKKAKILQGFFKTAKGQYGEGDIFLGVGVPLQRKIVRKYLMLKLSDLRELLLTNIHEYRLTALLILIGKYEKAGGKEKKGIFDFYLKNTKGINNWDLVDLSAPKIAGNYLLDKHKERKILYRLVGSSDLWEKRIAILATYAFIKDDQFEDILKIAEILLKDEHDLIHKAVGWMLRELGKRDQKTEEKFLKKYYETMPRTMLRYAIEKFDKKKRGFYLGRF